MKSMLSPLYAMWRVRTGPNKVKPRYLFQTYVPFTLMNHESSAAHFHVIKHTLKQTTHQNFKIEESSNDSNQRNKKISYQIQNLWRFEFWIKLSILNSNKLYLKKKGLYQYRVPFCKGPNFTFFGPTNFTKCWA